MYVVYCQNKGLAIQGRDDKNCFNPESGELLESSSGKSVGSHLPSIFKIERFLNIKEIMGYEVRAGKWCLGKISPLILNSSMQGAECLFLVLMESKKKENVQNIWQLRDRDRKMS